MQRPSDQEVAIRPAEDRDYEAIMALWSLAGLTVKPTGRDHPAAFAAQRARFPNSFLVAEVASELVGVVLGTHDGRKGWINRLAVHPDWRRRRLGAALICVCEASLIVEGIGITAALVEVGNDASCRVFEQAGYGNDIPVVYYRKLQRPDI